MDVLCRLCVECYIVKVIVVFCGCVVSVVGRVLYSEGNYCVLWMCCVGCG